MIFNQRLLFILVPFFILNFPYSKNELHFYFSDNDKTERKPLKILSYNLRFGELASLEEIADFIKEQDPDVIALQEVDSHTNRAKAPHQNGKDFATELGYRTGMFPAYGKMISFKGGYFGVAILSKYPIVKVERKFFPKTEVGHKQTYLTADIEYDTNKYFTFVSTHLDYTDSQSRQKQIDKLNETISSNKYPAIIGGDFNTAPDTKEIKEGMKKWNLLSNPKRYTFPADEPEKTIDYIFGYPKNKWEKLHDTTYNVSLSDHLPIGVKVKMKKLF